MASTEPSRPESPRPGERDHLARGMHPGVRPTRPGDPDAPATVEVGQHAFDLSLDGPSARLGLEAGELRAVVFDPCAVPHGAALSGDLRLVRRCRAARRARPGG